jgi:hypothetical protein
MFKKKQIRRMLEARVAEAGNEVQGRRRFVEEIRHDLLGVGEDDRGRPIIKDGSASADEFSLRELAEAICGNDFVEEYFDPRSAPDRQQLLEAGPGIDPTAFLNINTFSLATAGMIEAKIIEKFNNPAYIGNELIEVVPTNKNGEKMLGVTGIGDKADRRRPGEPHPRAQFGEHWITTPELEEHALAVEVTQEAVFYDLTNQVLDTAASVGDELGYKREKTIIDLAIGVTNPYKYNDVGYNTYQTAAPWINSHVNPLLDFNDINESLQLFSKLRDPATNKEILVMPTTILCQPSVVMKFRQFLNATAVEEHTQTATRVTIGPNPLDKRYTLLSSPIARNRVVDADGLNLGEGANAENRWWFGDFKQALKWMEAWPLRVRQASANEYVMLDRGLIAAYFANYRGIGAVREPRQVQENKNS